MTGDASGERWAKELSRDSGRELPRRPSQQGGIQNERRSRNGSRNRGNPTAMAQVHGAGATVFVRRRRTFRMLGRVRRMPGDEPMSRPLEDFPRSRHHRQERKESRKPKQKAHQGQATISREGQRKRADEATPTGLSRGGLKGLRERERHLCPKLVLCVEDLLLGVERPLQCGAKGTDFLGHRSPAKKRWR